MSRKVKLLAATVCVLVFTALAVYFLSTCRDTMLPQRSNVEVKPSMRVYLDPEHTWELDGEPLVWEDLSTRNVQTRTLWIVNRGDRVIDRLILASRGLPLGASLTWDYDGQALSPGQEMSVTLTLRVPADFQGKCEVEVKIFSMVLED